MLLFTFVFMQPPDWGDLPGVLAWIAAGPGATYVLLWALSYLAEYWPGWHKLPAPVKFLIPPLVSFGLSIVSSYALGHADLIDAIQPYWLMLVVSFTGWIASWAGHNTAKTRGVSQRYK